MGKHEHEYVILGEDFFFFCLLRNTGYKVIDVEDIKLQRQVSTCNFILHKF